MRLTGSTVTVASVRCSLRGVDQLPVELRPSGLHRSARQALLLPHTELSRLPVSRLLLLLSVTGDLHCIALDTKPSAAATATDAATTTKEAISQGGEKNVLSWLLASHVSAVWTQPLSSLSPLATAAVTEGTGAQHRTIPLLLTSGLEGLRIIQPQPTSTPLQAEPICRVTLPSECYPVAIDWRAGCVLTLRSYRGQLDDTAPSSASPLAYALSHHTVPFLHRLLSACLPSVAPLSEPPPSVLPSPTAFAVLSTAPASQPSSALLWLVLGLLRCCVDADSAALALELFAHSELVEEGCPVAALRPPLRSARIAAVHSLLATLANCLSTPCAYERVLAHVARKTDSSMWSRLFQLQSQHVKPQVDVRQQRQQPGQPIDEASRSETHSPLLSPIQLATACLAHRQFHTATLYLLVVQRTDSPRAAHRLAVQLLVRLEQRRQHLTSTTDCTAEQLDECEGELQLDRQVRRFAQQTAAIMKEQQLQATRATLETEHAEDGHTTDADGVSDTPVVVQSSDPTAATVDPPVEATHTENASSTSAQSSDGSAGGGSSCVLQ